MRLLLIALFTLFFITCERKEHEVPAHATEIRIKDHRAYCLSDQANSPFLVQEGNLIGSQRWSLLYESIEGFDYQEGYVYDLRVSVTNKETTLQDAPQDGSEKTYVLLDVISKTPVDTSGELLLSSTQH